MSARAIFDARDTSAAAVGAPIAYDGAPPPAVVDRESVYRRYLAAADGAGALAAAFVAAYASGVGVTWWILLLPPFAILMAKLQGLYDRDDTVIVKATLPEWRSVVQLSAITSIGVYLAWRAVTTAPEGQGMRVFALLTVAMFAFVLPGRMLARAIARQVSAAERCLIIGDPAWHHDLARRLDALDAVERIGNISFTDMPRSLEDLDSVVNQLGIHRMIVAPDPQTPDAEAFELVRSVKLLGVRVSLFPHALTALGGCGVIDDLDGLALLGVPRFGLSRSSARIKRTFDVVCTALTLVALGPLMLCIAAAIKLDSPGPVIFRQWRVGRHGAPFQIFKFRSMVENAEAMKKDLAEMNQAAAGLFKIVDDPRMTRVGRVLRRAHLDELPQLWNVVRGEMSMVGPRPLIEEEDKLFTGGDRHRLGLAPGITGPWQIRGPLAMPLSEMGKLDYQYVSNWSIWRDIDILIRTGARVFDGGGH